MQGEKIFGVAGSIKVPPESVKLIKAGVAQLVERQPSKLQVAGSSLVSRSMLFSEKHRVISRRSSGVEYFLGKEGVTGSNPVVGS